MNRTDSPRNQIIHQRLRNLPSSFWNTVCHLFRRPDHAARAAYGVARYSLRQAWRLVVIVVGVTVLLFGVALLVLPGPAFVVIPIGLAILGTELVWARRLLVRIKQEALNWTGYGRSGKRSAQLKYTEVKPDHDQV